MPVIVDDTRQVNPPARLTHGRGGYGPFSPGNDRLHTLEGSSPPPANTAIWVGIAAIVMMFAGFTSALVVRQGAGMDWQHLALPPILLFNTIVLLASSVTLELFRRGLPSRSTGALASLQAKPYWLYGTLALGLVFVIGQYQAWLALNREGLYVSTNPNCSFFYVLTGVHAAHVLGGLGGLVYIIMKFRSRQLRRSAFSTAATYWHFMDVLWIYLLALLWLKL
jgi:cytochrome c oxidase subunit III